ncbi:hypothetical protein IG631_02945 [Alternaria alternata]|nr:hypothetical protein IG631_02945 [Alternaria alternata]
MVEDLDPAPSRSLVCAVQYRLLGKHASIKESPAQMRLSQDDRRPNSCPYLAVNCTCVWHDQASIRRKFSGKQESEVGEANVRSCPVAHVVSSP